MSRLATAGPLLLHHHRRRRQLSLLSAFLMLLLVASSTLLILLTNTQLILASNPLDSSSLDQDREDDQQLALLTDPPVDSDELSTYKAIRHLHTKLDVDADGEVDDLESKRFLESDVDDGTTTHNKGGGGGAYSNAHKLKYLHQDGKDRSISVNDLWQAWKGSHVHNWTIDETVYWLSNYVELPEYSHLFVERSINGSVLPRLAGDTQFLNRLGITDPSAKKKISIKAMDVVLFGPPKFNSASRLRDIFVFIITLMALSACFVFYNRSITSQRALQALQTNLESLQKAEDQMHDLQHELDKALKAQEAVLTEKKNLEHQLEMQRQFSASSGLSEKGNSWNGSGSNRQQNSSSENSKSGDTTTEGGQDAMYMAKLEDDVRLLRKELEETYTAIEARRFRAPFPLRALLKATYEVESQYYTEKKLNLELKATEVKLRNQKLQKKKTSFLGYYKMAQEDSLEEDLNHIAEVKEAILQITKEIKERTERWKAIEELCGCPLDLTSLLMRV